MANINFLPNDFESTKQSLLSYYLNSDDDFLKAYFSNYSEGSTLSYVVDLFSYISTYFNFLTNVNANEPFLSVAQIERNIYAGASSLGYKPHRMVASQISYRITLNKEKSDTLPSKGIITIPQYTQFQSSNGSVFSLTEEIKMQYTDETILNNTTITSIDKYKIFRSYKDEKGVRYFDCSADEQKELNELRVDKDGTYFKPLYYMFKQGYFIINSYKSNGNKNQSFTINRSDIDDSNSSIIVTSLTDNAWYELTSVLTSMVIENNKEQDGTYKLISNLSTKPIYILSVTDTGCTFTFGDDVIGKKLDENDVVFVKLFVTSGVSSNGEKNLRSTENVVCKSEFSEGEKSISLSNFTLIVNSDYDAGSSGGANKQSAESVRQIAPYLSQSQGRIVSDADFKAFILGQDFVNVSDCKVISGEKYNPPFLGGTVVIVGKEDNSIYYDADVINLRKTYYLSEVEKLKLRSVIEPKCIVGNNNVTFIDPQYVYLYFGGSVYYDGRIYAEEEIRNELGSYNRTYFSSVNNFNNFFKMSQYVAGLLNQTNINYVDLTTNMFVVKRTPRNELYDNEIYITIGNAIEYGSVTSEFNNVRFKKIAGLNYDANVLQYFNEKNHNYLKVIDINKAIDGDYEPTYSSSSEDSSGKKFKDTYSIIANDGQRHYPMYYAYSMYDERIGETDLGDIKIKEYMYEWVRTDGSLPNENDLYPQNTTDGFNLILSETNPIPTNRVDSISATVGTVNYEKGTITLKLSLYEAMSCFRRFRFYDLIPMDKDYYSNEFIPEGYEEMAIPSLVEMLLRRNYSDEEYDGKAIYFTLQFKLRSENNFLNYGEVITKFLGYDGLHFNSIA